MSKATKQQLNTTSSTEAELVGCSDFITSAIFASSFLGAQGYEMRKTTLHQDNQSTIKLLVNGRLSCGKKSRHVDIRFFLVKDRIEEGEFKVEYCPTEFMIADFFTKPLQGSLLKKISAVTRGETDLITFRKDKPPSPKERVGTSTSTLDGCGDDITHKDVKVNSTLGSKSTYTQVLNKNHVPTMPTNITTRDVKNNSTYANVVKRNLSSS